MLTATSCASGLAFCEGRAMSFAGYLLGFYAVCVIIIAILIYTATEE